MDTVGRKPVLDELVVEVEGAELVMYTARPGLKAGAPARLNHLFWHFHPCKRMDGRMEGWMDGRMDGWTLDLEENSRD